MFKIICKIEFINKLFIKCINGPIISVTLVKSEDISNKFNINNLNEILYKSTNKKLNPNDYVTIIVKGIKFESKDQKIIITSHLDDIPNEDEIKEYFNENFDSEKIEEIKNEIEKILHLGDILISFGDFLENNAKLIPSGYIEELWNEELKKIIKEKIFENI